jgi:uncharacterized repeat protein (TIGR03803 family)
VRTFAQSALTVSLTGALLIGCGGLQPPISAPGAMPQASALAARFTSANYKVVYSFGAAPDGNYPSASLIGLGGTLYGTTISGGAACVGYGGCGTAFSVSPSGTEKVLHSFGAGYDGIDPEAGLTDLGGTLYGTTSDGGYSSDTCGYSSCGTVFSITPSGTEQVLHRFGKRDGIQPEASLIEVKGTLYGTTRRGGGNYQRGCDADCGTVFSITPSGAERVLHSFGADASDGTSPIASLIKVKDKLYGTTTGGGLYHAGTVFSITLNGREKVLHSFGYGDDGATPAAALIEVNGTLYGTTGTGGKPGCDNYDTCGTVFSITPSGTEKVLHRFLTGDDGRGPEAPLIEVKGKLYGTTFYGGADACFCGTVFSITLNGKERALYTFSAKPDGANPEAGLIDVDGTLYGTTYEGGTYGYGTVFALTP